MKKHRPRFLQPFAPLLTDMVKNCTSCGVFIKPGTNTHAVLKNRNANIHCATTRPSTPQSPVVTSEPGALCARGEGTWPSVTWILTCLHLTCGLVISNTRNLTWTRATCSKIGSTLTRSSTCSLCMDFQLWNCWKHVLKQELKLTIRPTDVSVDQHQLLWCHLLIQFLDPEKESYFNRNQSSQWTGRLSWHNLTDRRRLLRLRPPWLSMALSSHLL